VDVSREVESNRYQRVTATPPRAVRLMRDMRRVPKPPEQVHLRIGDRVRVEVVADRAGYLTVFNVGPTGNLNLLYPDDLDNAAAGAAIEPNRPLQIVDVEIVPPAGRERLFVLWSRCPLPLRSSDLIGMANRETLPVSEPYRATRDMKRVTASVRALAPADRHAIVIEIDNKD
jgi:hypothetical protein